MRDVPEIVRILREEEKNNLLKNQIKKNKINLDKIDEIYDDLWFNQWRFL